MPSFSQKSLGILATVDRRLYDIITDAIKIMDFSVIQGTRTETEQDHDYACGNSKLQWPNGKHDHNPSLAVDLAPDPIDFNYLPPFFVLAGIMLSCAAARGIKIRWGGDWDENLADIKSNKFNDIGHFEIVDL